MIGILVSDLHAFLKKTFVGGYKFVKFVLSIMLARPLKKADKDKKSMGKCQFHNYTSQTRAKRPALSQHVTTRHQ